MELTLKFDADALIDDIMGNFPEASSPSLRCTDFNYRECIFKFWDVETDPGSPNKALVMPEVQEFFVSFMSSERMSGLVYTVTREDLRRGLKLVLEEMHAGTLKGIAGYVLPNFTDAGRWDSSAADALVQAAIFGEVIYG